MKKLCLLAAALLAAAGAQAASITLTNPGFDDEGNAYPDGFDVEGTDVPGWSDMTTNVTDAGVENSDAWWGTYENNSTFMQIGDDAYNLSDHIIQAGEKYTFEFAGKSWDNASEFTVELFYNNPSNVISTFVTALDGTWTVYSNPDAIEPTPESVGGMLGISFLNTATAGFANLDSVSISINPFTITGSPTGSSADTDQTVEGIVEDLNDTFASATLSLDGSIVDSISTPSGGSINTLSYEATGLSIGVHNAEVIAIGLAESMTNSWTFEISQPPFDGITTSPTGTITNDSPTLTAVVIENFSTVDDATMWLDGSEVTPVTIAPSGSSTTTVTAATSALADGVHTAMVIVSGDPSGLETNEWTFTVVGDDLTQPVTLVHHWEFNETGSATNVPDMVGSAHGVVMGSNFAWTGSSIDLFGSGTSGDWNTNNPTAGAYVDLPNGIVSALGNDAVTFEVVFERDVTTDWSRIWDFGTSSLGEDQSDLGASDIFLTPSVGSAGNLRMEVASASPGFENVVVNITDPDAFANGQLTHVVVIYDSANQRTLMFVNGELKVANTAIGQVFPVGSITDVNNWIGRSSYANDTLFDGKVDDMRIYTGVMTFSEITARYNELVNTPTVDPSIVSISVAGATATISWVAEDKGVYTVLSTEGLTFPVWSEVQGGLTPSGDMTTNETDVTVSGDATEFYRIEGDFQ